MGERSEYPHGTFSWVDLSTTDLDAAKRFYGELFRWSYDDTPAGDAGTYTMVSRDGRHVAGMIEQGDVPPHWNNYVTVDDIEAAAKRVQELGGNLVEAPFDVEDSGRLALIQDPAKAMLCLWEPRSHPGAGLVNAPGALTWNDLVTPDPETAQRFYVDLFGWETDGIPDSGGYRTIRNGDRLNGGMQVLQPDLVEQGIPPHWMPYFGHEDAEEAIRCVEANGGTKLAGPIDMPAGRIAVFTDPAGALFAVWSGDYED